MQFKDYVDTSSSCMKLIGDVKVSKNLQYHLDNKLSLCDNMFRIYSESYFDLINEVKELYFNNLIEVNDEDAEVLETDIGATAVINEEKVYLDIPMLEEEEKHPLNKPMRTPGGPKKFKVYVKAPNGNIKTVRFGDPNLSIKNDNPSRAKSFRARHKCSEKKDKTTPGYWSCHIGRYAKLIGLKSSRPW